MVRIPTILKQKHRIIMLFVLALASIIFTGCNKGSLGIKSGAICGYVLDNDTNDPISEVLVRATGPENKTTYTGGDGSFTISDATEGEWTLSVEKFGYSLAESDGNSETANPLSCSIANGETIVLSPIKMYKTATGTRGILKGYPIDALTGRAITNFTVTQTTPYNQRKSKTFETATQFRDSGWSNLEGGEHVYTISATNYNTWSTTSIEGVESGNITIGKSAYDLGTIYMNPLKINVSGTLRNVPGYIIDANVNKNIVVWAESAGKIVASFTELDGSESSKGTIGYILKDIPVTAGSISVKCKIRGYDISTINSAVSIAGANPGGTIAGVDLDVGALEPIRADLRVVVTSSKPKDDDPGSFRPGNVARVYVRAGGTDVVPYSDVTSVNYHGEVTISGVITGYNIKVLVVNQNYGYYTALSDDILIPEGTDIYPVEVMLSSH